MPKETYTTEEKELIKKFRKGKISLSSFITSELFCGLTEKDLWQESATWVEIDGVRYKKDDLRHLCTEADKILNSKLWQQMTRMLKVAANRKMFYKATTENDLLFGKAMLYNLEEQEKFLKKISQLV